MKLIEETKMKRSKIRVIALLLAVIMAFGMLGAAPLTAFAEEAEEAAIEAVEAVEVVEDAEGAESKAGLEAFDADLETLEGEEEELVDPLAGPVAAIGTTTITIETAGYDISLQSRNVVVNAGGLSTQEVLARWL